MTLWRWLLRLILGVGGLAALYMVGAVVGAAVPVGDKPVSDGRSAEFFVQSNGIHLEFVIPLEATDRLDFAVGQLPGPVPRYAAFGWGERDFFLKTPNWADFDLGIAAGALLWQRDVLMRVRPQFVAPSGPNARLLRVSANQFDRVIDFIVSAIHTAADGPVTVESPLYDPAGIFLEGRGTYTPFYTCNEWVNDGLKQADIRTSAWSPFPHGVMWQLD